MEQFDSNWPVAGFPSRLLALAIDIVAYLVIYFVLILPLLKVLLNESGDMNAFFESNQRVLQITRNSFILLFYLPDTLFQGSIGKRVLGLRIMSATGDFPTLVELILRYLIKMSPVIFGLFFHLVCFTTGAKPGESPIMAFSIFLLLNYLWYGIIIIGFFLALGATGQAMHDRIAGTTVGKF